MAVYIDWSTWGYRSWLGCCLDSRSLSGNRWHLIGSMIYFSDPVETASRFGDYVEDFHDVFRCHGVDFGAVEDFFAFARTVIIAVASGGAEVAIYDRDMSTPVHQVIESLIGVGTSRKVEADQHDNLHAHLTAKETAQILALDRSSPADRWAAGDNDGLKRTDVIERTDVPRQTGALEPTDVPVHTGEPLLQKTASDSSSHESLPSSPNGSSAPSHGQQGPSKDYPGSLNDHGGSNTLAESLTRLELNSLQLKIYLDSIDQRISRMEPRLESVAPLVPSSSLSHPRDETGARFSATVPAATLAATTVPAATIPAVTIPRETNPAETNPAETNPAETNPAETNAGETNSPLLPRNDGPVSNQPDGAASEGGAAVEGAATAGVARVRKDSVRFYALRRQSTLPILVGVAMLLLGAFLFWRFGADTRYRGINRANAGEGGAKVAPHAAASVTEPQAAAVREHQAAAVREQHVAAAGDPSIASVRGAPGKSPASSDTGQGVSRPVDKPAPSSKKSAQVPFRSPLPSSSFTAADTHAAPAMATDAADSTDGIDSLSSVPLSNRLVNVSSGVMAANLVSAPQPSYPTLATLTRTQGNVVMQAVISKDGTVEELHVIKGHRLLRGAAKNAVRNWRYRPYKIGGVPVDVATTVSVDFSLHH
jgi:TonB family protein